MSQADDSDDDDIFYIYEEEEYSESVWQISFLPSFIIY